MNRIRLITLAATVAIFSSPSSAHHGWAGYLDEACALTGVVESANLGGPHGLLLVRSRGAVWDVVLSPPTRISRAGLTLAAVRRGTRVRAEGHRHRNAQRLEMKTERLVVGRRVFNLYPERS